LTVYYKFSFAFVPIKKAPGKSPGVLLLEMGKQLAFRFADCTFDGIHRYVIVRVILLVSGGYLLIGQAIDKSHEKQLAVSDRVDMFVYQRPDLTIRVLHPSSPPLSWG
jgi:hypothetical protein